MYERVVKGNERKSRWQQEKRDARRKNPEIVDDYCQTKIASNQTSNRSSDAEQKEEPGKDIGGSLLESVLHEPTSNDEGGRFLSGRLIAGCPPDVYLFSCFLVSIDIHPALVAKKFQLIGSRPLLDKPEVFRE